MFKNDLKTFLEGKGYDSLHNYEFENNLENNQIENKKEIIKENEKKEIINDDVNINNFRKKYGK
jgi:hypothetical protein